MSYSHINQVYWSWCRTTDKWYRLWIPVLLLYVRRVEDRNSPIWCERSYQIRRSWVLFIHHTAYLSLQRCEWELQRGVMINESTLKYINISNKTMSHWLINKNRDSECSNEINIGKNEDNYQLPLNFKSTSPKNGGKWVIIFLVGEISSFYF